MMVRSQWSWPLSTKISAVCPWVQVITMLMMSLWPLTSKTAEQAVVSVCCVKVLLTYWSDPCDPAHAADFLFVSHKVGIIHIYTSIFTSTHETIVTMCFFLDIWKHNPSNSMGKSGFILLGCLNAWISPPAVKSYGFCRSFILVWLVQLFRASAGRNINWILQTRAARLQASQVRVAQKRQESSGYEGRLKNLPS